MSKTNRKPAAVTVFDVSSRAYLAAAYDRATSGHPKPELAAKCLAALEAFDKAHPAAGHVRHRADGRRAPGSRDR